MSSQKEHSPQHEELLKRQALEQAEVKEVLVFFQKYAKPASIAIAVICVAILANKLSQTNRIAKEAKADAALLNAQTPEALEAVYNDYGSTAAAPFALMNLAKMEFNRGEIEQAEAHYNTFLSKYSKHALAGQAQLNLISCIEAKGEPAEAERLYTEFGLKHSGDAFLAPSALIGKGRTQETQKKFAEARMTYEDLIVNHPDTSWAQIAEMKLQSLDRQK